MVAPVNGGGGNAAAAAAEAARRAAEEAARRAAAEAARRAAAEAAKQAALAAQKAAQQAAQKASEQAAKAATARQAADTAKAAAKNALDQAKNPDNKSPAAQKQAQAAAQQATKDAAAQQKAAETAQKAADAAKTTASKAADAAKASTAKANEAARADGKPEPFPAHGGMSKTGFDSNHVDARRKLGDASAPSRQEMQGQVGANQEYARLAQKPETRQALDKLGIKDGAGLKDFGSQLARAADGGTDEKATDSKLADARKGTDAKALAEVLQTSARAAGEPAKALTDPKIADAVASGKSPHEAVAAQKGEALSPEQKQSLQKLDVKPEEYAAASKEAQAHLDAASKALTENKPQQALAELQGAAAAGSRDLAEKGLKSLAEQQQGAAKELLSNPDVAKKALDDKATGEALGKVLGGDSNAQLDGLKDLAKSDSLREVVAKVADKIPGVKEALSKLGLDSKDLSSAKEMLPSVLDAAQKVGKGDFSGALDSMRDALKKGGPLSEKLLTGLASQLPDGVAKNILKDPSVVKQLINNDAAFDSAKKLFNKDTALDGIGGLLGNDSMRNAVLDAAGKDPSIKAQLDKVGLTAADLKQAGAAAPHLFEAGRALLSGNPDWKKAADELSKAGAAAPDVLNKIGQKLYEKLPQGVKDTMSKMGLDAKDLSSAKDMMPSVLEAAQKVGKGDFSGALDSMRDALKKGGPLSEKLLTGLASQLPDGVAKNILKDPSVVKQLINNDAAFDSAKKLFNKDTALDGIGGLLSNDSMRNAVLDAAGKDPSIKAQLDKVGLTAADLKQAGAAAPHLFEAGRALLSGNPDWKKAADELSKAGAAAPELLNKIGQKLYEKLPQGVKDTMSKMGLDAKDLSSAKEMLPSVLEAAQKVGKGDFSGALDSMRDALKKGGPLSEKLLKGLASQLPDGVAKNVLKDPGVINQLINNDAAFDSAKKLFNKDTALDGIGGLLSNDSMRNAVLDAAGKDPDIKAQLDKVGLTAADLKQAGAAAPHLFEAGRALLSGNPDWKKAADELSKAGAAAPDVLNKIGQKLYEKLPQGVKDTMSKMGLDAKDLSSAKDMMPSVLEAAQKVGKGDFSGALDSMRDALKKGGPLSEKLLKGLASQLPDGVAKNILKDPSVINQLINNDAAFDSAKKLFNKDTALEGIGGLLTNDSMRDAVVDAAAKDPGFKGLMDKVGLTATDLKQAGAAAPHLFEAARALFDGKGDYQKALSELGQAGAAAPDLLNKLGQKIYEKLPASIQKNLSDLGLTKDTLKEAGAALPHLIEAGKDLAAGKPEDALKEMGQALEGSPEVVSTALNALGQHLKPGIVKDLLTDKDLIKTLVSNKDLHSSIGQILSGTPEGIKNGLTSLSANAPVMKTVADALWKNDGLRGQLQKLGFTSAQDLADAGKSFADVMSLKDTLSTSPLDVRKAMEDGLNVINDLPDGLKHKIGDALTKTLHLPAGLANMIVDGAETLKDPAVRKNLTDAVDAFQKKDVGGFIKALGATGQSIADKHPDLAVDFLDMMGHLPGSVGRFFSDHNVNEGLVKSGAMSEVFQATQKLASGDILGALKDVMEGAGKVMGYGDHYKLSVPIWPHHPSVTLPFGEEGMKLMAGLAKQFVSALPESVRTKIETKITEAVAKAGGAAIPGGSIISAVGDGIDLVGELSHDKKDWVAVGLKSAEVALDVAGTFPGLGAITGPLRGLVGTIDVLHDAQNMISDVQSFGKEFAFGSA